jgi:hypothetical protein
MCVHDYLIFFNLQTLNAALDEDVTREKKEREASTMARHWRIHQKNSELRSQPTHAYTFFCEFFFSFASFASLEATFAQF